MALPVGGGDQYPPIGSSGHPYFPAKRRTVETGDDDYYHHPRNKRQRQAQYAQYADYVAFKATDELPLSRHPPLHQPKPRPHPHHRYPSPHPHVPSPEPTGTAAPAMERTASGHSIRSDPTERCGRTELLEDEEAAQRVRDHLANFRRRNPDSKHERILRSIISPRRRRHHHHHRHSHHRPRHTPTETKSQDESDEYPLDNDALESIFSAANNLFFNGRLSQRVRWDWSHESAARYDSRVIGTTALRRAGPTTRGFETLIVLSSTILRDSRFSRRLLISTFLHELIHSYLFICCGFRARCDGGHTRGFREIAEVIDEWAGKEAGLFLGRVEADLEMFRIGGGGIDGCRDEESEGSVDEIGTGGRDGAGGSAMKRSFYYPCLGRAEQREYAIATTTTTTTTTPPPPPAPPPPPPLVGGGSFGRIGFDSGFMPQEIVKPEYFGSGVAPTIPGYGVITGQQTVAHYSASNSSNAGIADDTWWRQHRAVRPVYIYPGDELTASYVYSTNSMLQRP